MGRHITWPNHVMVEADVPVLAEHKMRSGLWAPARLRAERFGKSEGGFLAYNREDVQIVSGTVITAPSSIGHVVKVPARTASLVGGRTIPSMDGTVSLEVLYDGPKPGDKVYFGYGTWGIAESEEDVFIDGDKLYGRIHAHSINLIQHDGEWRCAGPWAILEPVPTPVPDGSDLVGFGVVGAVPLIGYVRVAPSTPHMPALEVGAAVRFKSAAKPSLPTPFSESDWYRVPVSDIFEVAGMAPPRDEIDALWARLHDHNATIARFTAPKPIEDGDVYHEQYMMEMAENFMADVRKRYKSNLFKGR